MKLNLDNYKDYIIAVSGNHLVAYCTICNIPHSFSIAQYVQEIELLRAKDKRIAEAIPHLISHKTGAPVFAPGDPINPKTIHPGIRRGGGSGAEPPSKQKRTVNHKKTSTVRKTKQKTSGRAPEAVSQHKLGEEAKRSEAERTPDEQGGAAHTSA